MSNQTKIVKAFKLLSTIGFLGFFISKVFFYFFLSYTVALIFQVFFYFKKNGSNEKSYYAGLYLSLLNPYNLILLSKQVAGQFYLRRNEKQIDPLKFQNEANYILPFEGKWKVVNGGLSKDNSHSWQLLTQRYAYDFCIYNKADIPYENDGKLLDDYLCYSSKIISPADGIVVEIKDGITDFKNVGTNAIDWRAKDFRGNHIIIKHAKNEFSFIAHLKKDSLVVNVGDELRQGQMIGLCGNSGHSTMPHIHFHIQDSKSFWFGMGLPIKFNNVFIETDNTILSNNTYIVKDQLVCNSPL